MEFKLNQPSVEIPLSAGDMSQDEEYVLVDRGNFRKRVRILDYCELYSMPGLYEQVVYNILNCSSPKVITTMLKEQLLKEDVQPKDLNVLDMGAGNGMLAEELTSIGVEYIIGIDILDEAKSAAMRDRPSVYKDYLVTDLSKAGPKTMNELEHMDINCIASVASIGFGDIPPITLANAIDLGHENSWIALSIKEEFLKEIDTTGISDLFSELVKHEVIEIKEKKNYVHRRSISGNELIYDAIIARKNQDIPAQIINNI